MIGLTIQVSDSQLERQDLVCIQALNSWRFKFRAALTAVAGLLLPVAPRVLVAGCSRCTSTRDRDCNTDKLACTEKLPRLFGPSASALASIFFY